MLLRTGGVRNTAASGIVKEGCKGAREAVATEVQTGDSQCCVEAQSQHACPPAAGAAACWQADSPFHVNARPRIPANTGPLDLGPFPDSPEEASNPKV